jgi:hypothetical protein
MGALLLPGQSGRFALAFAGPQPALQHSLVNKDILQKYSLPKAGEAVIKVFVSKTNIRLLVTGSTVPYDHRNAPFIGKNEHLIIL